MHLASLDELRSVLTLRQEAIGFRKQAADADKELRAYLDGLTIAD